MTTPSARRRSRWPLLLALLVDYLAAMAAVVLTVAVASAPGGTGGGAASGTTYAFMVSAALLSVVAATMGALILSRQPHHLVGRLMIVGAIFVISAAGTWPLAVLAGYTTDGPVGLLMLPVYWWGNNGVLIGVLLLFPAVATVFPDGHLPGPRFRLPVVITILLVAAATVLITIGPTRPGSDAAPNPLAIPGLPYEVADLGQALGGLSVLLAFLLAVAAVVVRFRRSRGVERAQMKWLLASMTVMAVLFPISWGTDYGPSDLLDLASVFSGALMPVAIGIAILRYRLYDIDRIISRTLGWAVLTAILVAVFAVVVVGSQAVLAPVTEGNTLAVAVSTLAAAALFQPLRRRVQGIVDRRFDRARVDRERTAAMFADRMRDEVAIATLTTDLQHTVDRTLRPSAQAIWLRTNAR